jgi:hypothetical protein
MNRKKRNPRRIYSSDEEEPSDEEEQIVVNSRPKRKRDQEVGHSFYHRINNALHNSAFKIVEPPYLIWLRRGCPLDLPLEISILQVYGSVTMVYPVITKKIKKITEPYQGKCTLCNHNREISHYISKVNLKKHTETKYTTCEANIGCHCAIRLRLLRYCNLFVDWLRKRIQFTKDFVEQIKNIVSQLNNIFREVDCNIQNCYQQFEYQKDEFFHQEYIRIPYKNINIGRFPMLRGIPEYF